MNPSRRVLIAGCGYVGCALGRRLVADGNDVWGLRRRPTELPAGVRPLVADLGRPETLEGFGAGWDLVCYCVSSDRRDDDAYRRAYVDGIGHLLAALEGYERRPRRVVYVSSTAVYGQTDGALVDERSPAEPTGFPGRRLLEGERVAADGPFPATVLRLGGIYGPGRTRLLDSVREGRPVRPSGPPVYSNRIHLDDCVGALEHLLAHDDPAPVYLGVDRAPVPIQEVVDWLAAELGVPRPPARPSDGRSPRGNKRCYSDLLVASGYRFVHPSYREGYAALLAQG